MLLIYVLACGPHVPPAPPLPIWRDPIDRSTLPDVRITVAHVSTFSGTGRQVAAGGAKGVLELVAEVLIVEHPTEGIVLLDSGYASRSIGHPEIYPGKFLTRILQLDITSSAAERLAELGKSPSDVRQIVLTHLHHDHAGGVEDFPEATLVVTADEWAEGQTKSMLHGYAPEPYLGREPRLISFEGTMPFGPFPQHVDLFGDGSIILLPSPGHTVGSMSVLVQSSGGRLLYLGDAAWVDDNWQIPTPKGLMARTLVEADWRQGFAALHRVKAWAAADPDLIVVSGHDPANRTRFPWPEPVITP